MINPFVSSIGDHSSIEMWQLFCLSKYLKHAIFTASASYYQELLFALILVMKNWFCVANATISGKSSWDAIVRLGRKTSHTPETNHNCENSTKSFKMQVPSLPQSMLK